MRLIALGMGCVVALLLMEVGLRLFNPLESRLRGDHIILPASKTYVYESGIKGTDKRIVHSKNALGFRGPERPPGGLAGLLSVVAVGGSTTECVFLSDGKDWPALLQERLESAFEPVWVNNAGLDGHSTFGHEVLLRDVVLDLEPTLILLLVGANDRGRVEAGAHTASHIRGPLRLDSLEGFAKSASAHSEIANLGLSFYRYLRARREGLPHVYVDLRSLPQSEDRGSASHLESLEPHAEVFVPAFEARVRKLVEMARGSGVEPVLMTQPLLFGEGEDPTTGVDLARVRLHGGVTGKQAWDILELYNQTTRRLGEEEGLLVIDLSRELEKDSRYFYDGMHFSNAGSARVSEIMHQRLQPYLMEHYSSFSQPVNSQRSPPSP